MLYWHTRDLCRFAAVWCSVCTRSVTGNKGPWDNDFQKSGALSSRQTDRPPARLSSHLEKHRTRRKYGPVAFLALGLRGPAKLCMYRFFRLTFTGSENTPQRPKVQLRAAVCIDWVREDARLRHFEATDASKPGQITCYDMMDDGGVPKPKSIPRPF